MQGHSQLHSQLEASPGYLPLYNQIPKTFTSLIIEQFVGCCLHPRVGDTYRIARRCCGDLEVAVVEVEGYCAPRLGRHTKEQFRLLRARRLLETPEGGKNGWGWVRG